MKQNLAIAVMTFGLIGQACADAPAPVADGQWRGLAGASAAMTSGNSSSSAFLLNADVARLTTADKISLNAFVNYAKSKTNGVNNTTSDKEGLAGRYDYNLTPKIFAFGGAAFDHDKMLNISIRSLLTAGLGYHVIQTKENTFDVFGGLSYNDTSYSVSQTIGGETKKDFNSFGLMLGEESSHHFNETVFVKQRLEYFPGLTGAKMDVIKFNASLNVAMSKTLALSVGVIDTYNSKVGIGQKKNDMSLFTGISVMLGN